MTYDDDFVVLRFDHGTVRQPCAALGLSWPPPERIDAFGILMRRERHSSITDEQRAAMTHVCRGAEYVVAAIGERP
jgi:hypothetical protein